MKQKSFLLKKNCKQFYEATNFAKGGRNVTIFVNEDKIASPCIIGFYLFLNSAFLFVLETFRRDILLYRANLTEVSSSPAVIKLFYAQFS